MKNNNGMNNLKRTIKASNKIKKDSLQAKRRCITKTKAFIDKNTGDISFAGKDMVLNQYVSRHDLESCPDVVITADEYELGNDRRIYYLSGFYVIARMNFEISLYCEGDRIKEVWMRNARMDFQDYCCHWSEKKQLERIRIHEKWLERVFGNKRTNDFHWGWIVSNYNPVMGMSYISVAYKSSNSIL